MQTATVAPFFSMRLETYEVSVKDVFAGNRQRLIDALQSSGVRNSIVFIRGGLSETRFDSDHEPIFRQESYFWYLSGVKEPDCSLSVNINNGDVCLFIPRLPESYATIMGRIRTCREWKELYHVDEVKYTDDIEAYLLSQLKDFESTTTEHSCPKLLLLRGLNSDSGKIYEPPSTIINNPKLSPFIDLEKLFPVLAELRVIKSKAELALLQHVTEVTSFAHAYVMRKMKVGMMEYQAESLFRHYCYYNYGCRLVGYTPICGCGPNAAILHYGHAGEPNARQSVVTDICLFDMGAEYFGYGSDVTCSFPVNGTFSEKQRPIYTAVLHAQITVYDMVRPGVSWVDCHKAAEKAILKGLTDIGIVVPGNKSLDELVELRLGAVFMPHGLGHLIGIDTHDVGGYLPGHPQRMETPGLRSLRTARILQENMTLTVEPGCYFIDHLLDTALGEESPLKCYLNPDRVNDYRGFGGVRIEDVIHVTSIACVNFTLCPRTINEIEYVMKGGKWPPIKDEAPALRRARLTDQTPLAPPPSH